MTRVGIVAACIALLGVLLLHFSEPTFAATGVPAFCVKIGGPKGPDDYPLICRFFTYQDCLDAAADVHGYCVANMDYKGDSPTGSPPRPRRPK